MTFEVTLTPGQRAKARISARRVKREAAHAAAYVALRDLFDTGVLDPRSDGDRAAAAKVAAKAALRQLVEAHAL